MHPSSQRATLAKYWDAVCNEYYPRIEGFWRHNIDADIKGLPHAGWKIHISATIHSACIFLEIVHQIAKRHHTLVKVPRTLEGVAQINQGIGSAYSQVGKIFTLYPHSEETFIKIIKDLANSLPDADWPNVPFDRQVFSDKPIFYRYGIIDGSVNSNGGVHAYQSPSGEWVADSRGPGSAIPEWLSDPFPVNDLEACPEIIHSGFMAVKCLSQRGKGGVFLAFDLDSKKPNLCILKEGRRHGETDYDGIDGRQRVKNEHEALTELRHLNLTPKAYGAREIEGGFYLKMEPLAGEYLSTELSKKMSGETLRRTSLAFLESLSDIHKNGWIWNDCKPTNIIVPGRDQIKFIDFEGASRTNVHTRIGFGSPGYMPPGQPGQPYASHYSNDIFSAGVVMHEITGGELVIGSHGPVLRGHTWRLPTSLCSIIEAMREKSPDRRPDLLEICNAIRQSPEWN